MPPRAKRSTAKTPATTDTAAAPAVVNKRPRKDVLRKTALHDEIRYNHRIRGLLSTYSQADSIISGRDVKTRMVYREDINTPAWTEMDGSAISFNTAFLGPADNREDYIRITGANYHELSHVLFTPKRGNAGGAGKMEKYEEIFRQYSMSSAEAGPYYEAFNLLEDQRIESLMVVKASATRAYFSAAISSYITGDEQSKGLAYLLVYGRKYLGQKVIDAAKAEWAHDPALLPEIEQIISQYRTIDVFDGWDVSHAIQLIKRMVKVLEQIRKDMPPDQQPDVIGRPHGVGTGVNHCGADHTSKGDQQRAVRAVVRGQDKPLDDQPDEDGEGDDGEDADALYQGQNGAGAEGEDEGAIPGGNGAGNFRGVWQGGSTLEELLAALNNDVESSFQIATDYDRYRSVVTSSRVFSGGSVHDSYNHWSDGAGAGEVTALVRRVAAEFQRLVEQAAPGWTYRESTGRFNINRYAAGERDMDELFDEWEEGNADATSIETVVLLDISSSVYEWQAALSDVAWVVKRAADTVNIPCTVLVYDSHAYYVYKRNERASVTQFPALNCVGGTNPGLALAEAMTILAGTTQKKRYLLTMTDGEWFSASVNLGRVGNKSCDALVKEISNLPRTITEMIYFKPMDKGYKPGSNAEDQAMDRVDWHNHQRHVLLTDLSLLPSVFRQTVSALIQAR